MPAPTIAAAPCRIRQAAFCHGLAARGRQIASSAIGHTAAPVN